MTKCVKRVLEYSPLHVYREPGEGIALCFMCRYNNIIYYFTHLRVVGISYSQKGICYTSIKKYIKKVYAQWSPKL